VELARIRPLIVVSLLASAICLAIAPLGLPDGYSVVGHTTSEAAAQATQGAWLARTGFLLFGMGVLFLSITKRGWPPTARVLHGAFGLFMIAAGVYSHRPFLEGVDFDHVEDLFHSVAATGMGFAFALGVLVVGWRRIPRWRLADAVALAAAIAVPIAMMSTTGADGLLQRGMFVVAYLWYGAELLDLRRRSAFDTVG
jgi:hypothetical protein